MMVRMTRRFLTRRRQPWSALFCLTISCWRRRSMGSCLSERVPPRRFAYFMRRSTTTGRPALSMIHRQLVVFCVLILAQLASHRHRVASAAAWCQRDGPRRPAHLSLFPMRGPQQQRRFAPASSTTSCSATSFPRRPSGSANQNDPDFVPTEEEEDEDPVEDPVEALLKEVSDRTTSLKQRSSGRHREKAAYEMSNQLAQQLAQLITTPPKVPSSSSTSGDAKMAEETVPRKTQNDNSDEELLWNDDDDDDESMHVELDEDEYLNALNNLEVDGSLRMPSGVRRSVFVPPPDNAPPDAAFDSQPPKKASHGRPKKKPSSSNNAPPGGKPTLNDLLQAIQAAREGGGSAPTSAAASGEELHRQVFREEEGFARQSEVFRASLMDPSLTDNAAANRRGTEYRRRQIQAVRKLERNLADLREAVAHTRAARGDDPRCPKCGTYLTPQDDALRTLPQHREPLCQICFAQQVYQYEVDRRRRQSGAGGTPWPMREPEFGMPPTLRSSNNAAAAPRRRYVTSYSQRRAVPWPRRASWSSFPSSDDVAAAPRPLRVPPTAQPPQGGSPPATPPLSYSPRRTQPKESKD